VILSNGPSGVCGVAVMAKASEPGRTKTRMVPPLTHQEASAFNTVFLQDVASNILAAAEHTSITGYIAFGPPGSKAFFEGKLPAEIGLFESWHPNFGDCLYNTLHQIFMRGHAIAIVLNSDSPTLPTSLLADAVEVLAQPGERAVLGPSEDGGYYLLGLKKNQRRLFEDIDWSTERVARQTLARAAEIGLRTHVLATWYDVDDTTALTRLKSELLDHQSFDRNLMPFSAPQTTRLMRALLADDDFRYRLRWEPSNLLKSAGT
jgi:rSAM/selenodomain-associated transferase 1